MSIFNTIADDRGDRLCGSLFQAVYLMLGILKKPRAKQTRRSATTRQHHNPMLSAFRRAAASPSAAPAASLLQQCAATPGLEHVAGLPCLSPTAPHCLGTDGPAGSPATTIAQCLMGTSEAMSPQTIFSDQSLTDANATAEPLRLMVKTPGDPATAALDAAIVAVSVDGGHAWSATPTAVLAMQALMHPADPAGGGAVHVCLADVSVGGDSLPAVTVAVPAITGEPDRVAGRLYTLHLPASCDGAGLVF
jgi:hypothetical protein